MDAEMIRYVLVPWNGNGVPYYTDGVITHRQITLEEFQTGFRFGRTNDLPGKFDDPETVWKEKGVSEIPEWIEDKDGNRYVLNPDGTYSDYVPS